jgi:hypothetical protein
MDIIRYRSLVEQGTPGALSIEQIMYGGLGSGLLNCRF